jgi:Zn-dependent protease/CBS domain-containing protein
VPVRAHWSVLIVLALIAPDLAGGALAGAWPGRPVWLYWLVALAASVVFLLGLLAHEVAHAVVARRNGVGVRGITLWMFGGVTEMTGTAASPGADLRIAGAGPLVSLLLGAGFVGLALLVAALGGDGLLVAALGWLGVLNVLLALFNVLPGAPLDGGRLLRAALWQWRGNRTWAAIAAARVGTVLGAALVVLGALQFLRLGGDVSGLWLALVGWFLMGAARTEERQTRMWGPLEGILVRAVMDPHPATAPPGMSVAELLASGRLDDRDPAVVLVEDERPVGLVTLETVRALAWEVRTTTTLGAVATPIADVPVTSPDLPVIEVLPRLGGAGGGRMPVVEDGRLVGILAATDLLQAAERLRGAGAGPKGSVSEG